MWNRRPAIFDPSIHIENHEKPMNNYQSTAPVTDVNAPPAGTEPVACDKLNVGGVPVGECDDNHGTGAPDISDDPMCAEHDAATMRVAKNIFSFIEEPTSFTALRDLFAANPLCTVMASKDSGNVLILLDCNVFGETDARQDLRQCPIGTDKFDILIRAIIAARHGRDDPPELHIGDFYMCINGGKHRKRSFMKPMQNPHMKKNKDKNRLFARDFMLHATERSWRQRKRCARGQARLTQMITMCANKETFAMEPQREYIVHGGSTLSDVFGPVELDPLVDLPRMRSEDKKGYFGKRYVLAGGNVDNDDDVDSAAEPDDDTPSSTTQAGVPISYHCLPTSVITDFVQGFGITHIIDLAPTPLNLAFKLAELGCSYVALCASEQMRMHLKQEACTALKAGIIDKNQKYLYDPRFADLGPEAVGDEFRSTPHKNRATTCKRTLSNSAQSYQLS
jgi:hypothetical protein